MRDHVLQALPPVWVGRREREARTRGPLLSASLPNALCLPPLWRLPLSVRPAGTRVHYCVCVCVPCLVGHWARRKQKELMVLIELPWSGPASGPSHDPEARSQRHPLAPPAVSQSRVYILTLAPFRGEEEQVGRLNVFTSVRGVGCRYWAEIFESLANWRVDACFYLSSNLSKGRVTDPYLSFRLVFQWTPQGSMGWSNTCRVSCS